MSFVAVTVGTAVASTGYKIFDSVKKSKQAAALAASNKRPVYEHPQEIDDVYNMALSEVNNTQEQDLATQQMNQNASAGIDAILKSGGRADFGVINATYGKQLQGVLASVQRQRDARIAAANNAAYNLGKAKDAEFQFNKEAPFKDTKQEEALLRQQSEQSKMDAINGAVSVAGSLATMNTRPGDYGGTGGIDEAQGRVDAGTIDPNNPTAPTPTRTIGDRTLPNINQPSNTPQVNDGYYEPNTGMRIGGGNNSIVGVDAFGNFIYKN